MMGEDYESPSLGYNVGDYMNRADVRKLLHIKDTLGPWQVCSDFIYNNWKFQKEGSVFIYNMLKAAGIRVLIYSGDTDMMVATVGTEEWI